MMKQLLRILSVVIAAAMITVFIPTAAYAASNEFIVQNGVLTQYTGPGGAVVIPGNLGITTIGKGAFSSNGELTDPAYANLVAVFQKPGITSCVIPEGVTTIEADAFSWSLNLADVTLPDSLTAIGDGAFSTCPSLISLKLPDSVTAIGQGIFANDTNLKQVNLPAGLKTIPKNAFINCRKLTSVTIPYGVASIEDSAYAFCYGLTSVSIHSSVLSIGFNAFDWCFGLKTVYIPDSVRFVDNNAFYEVYGLTIQATEGSFLEQYAKNVGLKYQEMPAAVKAVPTTATVMIDGKAIAFRAYNIDGYNYFRLRDLAMALKDSGKKFGVDWDSAAGAIRLRNGWDYMPVGGELQESTGTSKVNARHTAASVYLDGTRIGLTGYNIDGYNYFKLREIGYQINFGVTWVESSQTIQIDTAAGYKT